MRVPVYAGPRIIAFCDAVSVRRFLDAANVEIVRKRKTGKIVQINLASYGDDSKLPSIVGNANPTYEERLETHTLIMLKRFDERTQRLECWGDDDSFNPQRFNPDRVQIARHPNETESQRLVEIAAKPADAPRVPPARFCAKRDPELPWSAGNSREVF